MRAKAEEERGDEGRGEEEAWKRTEGGEGGRGERVLRLMMTIDPPETGHLEGDATTTGGPEGGVEVTRSMGEVEGGGELEGGREEVVT